MNRPVRWRLLSAGTLTIALVVGAAPLSAGAASSEPRLENSAVAEAHRPGERVAESAVNLVVVQGRQPVRATNLAVAHSTCDGCRAVAASLQVVVVRGDGRTPVDVDAGNAALALNENCAGCEALADAHQLVVVTGPRTRLSPWVYLMVAMMRRTLAHTVGSDLPLAELRARIDTLADRLQNWVQSGLSDGWDMWDKTRADIDTRPPDRRMQEPEQEPTASPTAVAPAPASTPAPAADPTVTP
jgi:hypothetical protein